jgi:hypothetical protein
LSRQIDLEDKELSDLSDEDLRYMAQYENVPSMGVGNLDRALGFDNQKVREELESRRIRTADVPHTGSTLVLSQEELDFVTAMRAAKEQEEVDANAEKGGTFQYDGDRRAADVEEVDEPYSAWKNADLEAEIDARNNQGKTIAKGKKDDMVAALEADDEADEG